MIARLRGGAATAVRRKIAEVVRKQHSPRFAPSGRDLRGGETAGKGAQSFQLASTASAPRRAAISSITRSVAGSVVSRFASAARRAIPSSSRRAARPVGLASSCCFSAWAAGDAAASTRRGAHARQAAARRQAACSFRTGGRAARATSPWRAALVDESSGATGARRARARAPAGFAVAGAARFGGRPGQPRPRGRRKACDGRAAARCRARRGRRSSSPGCCTAGRSTRIVSEMIVTGAPPIERSPGAARCRRRRAASWPPAFWRGGAARVGGGGGGEVGHSGGGGRAWAPSTRRRATTRRAAATRSADGRASRRDAARRRRSTAAWRGGRRGGRSAR